MAELLELRAETRPGEGYSFLLATDVDGPRAELSYAQLFARALELAARLDAAGARGERVVMVFAPGLEFIVGLFGCLLAGVIAVPVYPPNPSRLHKTLPLLEAIAADCEARFALTSPDLIQMKDAVAQLSERLAGLTWLSTASGDDGTSWSAPRITPDQLAFLQYTSGSTGEPKGVMLSHANLLCNQAMIAAGFGHGASTRVVGWLPLYHDMGLIGNVLNPMWVGSSALLMSPITFIKRPMIWLEAISSFGAHTSGGPNFAYDLCVERIEPGTLERIDLSGWKVAFNGAEPIRRATLDRFANAFASAGFDRRALLPCYGLAEATLAVTAAFLDASPRVLEVDRKALESWRIEPSNAGDEALSLVSSGCPLAGSEVVIIDHDLSTITGGGRVGEICVRGAAVARGYWGRPELSRATFEVELIGDPGGPWLRTGDLGFVDGGELFVCGRRKDLLIVRGRNLHPHDLERAIGDANADVRSGCVVAFAAEHEDNEEIVVVAEIREPTAEGRLQEIARTIREVLSTGFGVRPLEVVLVQPHSLPKTSSGKLRRGATRDLWRVGRLERLAHVDQGPSRAEAEPPHDTVEARVLEICAEVLEIPHLARDDDFFKLGADSLVLATMTSRLEVVLAHEIPLGAVFDSPSVSGLMAWLRADGCETPQPHPRELPLTPDMRRLLALAGTRDLPADTLHLAAAFALRGAATVEELPAALEIALQNFATRHGALRTGFAESKRGPEKGVVQQQIHPRVALGLERRTLSKLDELDAVYAEFVRRPFTLERPPLWRSCLVEIASGEPVLCVVAHHLVSDHASFRTLVSELEAELGGDGRSLQGADEGALVRLAHGKHRIDSHATESFSGIEPLSFASIAGRPPDAGHAAGSLFVELDPATCAGLDALARSLGVLPAALGLAVLQLLLRRVCGVDRFIVGVPVDQRIVLGTAGAVGYFTVPSPVACEVHSSDTPRVLARRAQGQLRRVMDHPGLPATLSATLERALGRCPGVPLLQVLFNALPASERLGPVRGPTLQRLPLGPVTLDIDLSLALVRGPTGGAIELHHRLDVLDPVAAHSLVDTYVELLAGLARDVDTPVSRCVYPSGCPQAALRRRIALASTFTADPLVPIIVGWGRLFEAPFEVEPAPYGQIIQPLLDPTSPLRSRDAVARVLLVRLVDVFRDRREPPSIDDYRDWCADLFDAVREAVGAGLMIIGLAPSDASGELAALEIEFAEELAALSCVRVIRPDAMLSGLEVDTLYDAQADALAHVPFSAPTYAAFATAIVRELWNHDRQPLKLVAVDADDTLWSGVLGEDGPNGIDPGPFVPLHERLRHCRASGVLLAIISNNDPDLVRTALAHTDLPSPDDFVAIEGGYDSKATRLVGLADRLSLGVDSFCFIDDNEVEVAAMRDACPESLAFALPPPVGRDGSVGGFVRRLWALDADARTQADRDRPQRYVEDGARRSSRQLGQDHVDFVRSLELVVTARPLEEHLERAAQLSERTNQFNLRRRPRTADELSRELEQPDVRAAVFEVKDRFGEYGIVGLLVARVRGSDLLVDTLLLSCRVLGRGVELELLRWLAEQADEAGASAVRMLAESSPRNTPARRFVRRVGDASGGELIEAGSGELGLRVAVADLRSIGLPELLERVEASSTDASSRRLDVDRRLEARRLSWIARELARGEDVLRAFGVRWLRPGDAVVEDASEPDDLLARQIAARMGALLALPAFGTRTDFVAAGASSLTAVELLADLRRVLGLALTLDNLMAAPTARALAAVAARVREGDATVREIPLAHRMAIDAQLDPALAPASGPAAPLEPRRVLLTGATGFVGAHLLFELLRRTDATVVCLIRAGDAEHGWERLRVAIERVDLTWSRALRRRVEILPGDLASPRLGLKADIWRREAEELDAIFHCGAIVNFSQPYPLLRATNVCGTRALIELACAERPTPLHHISTTGVLIGRACLARERLEEDTLPGSGAELPIGYQQSKWVAERLVLEAGARGLPVAIYRPGNIGPHSATGSHNPDDLFMLLLRAADRLRCLPDVRDLDAAPVDWVVAMVAALARTNDVRGHIVHLVNPSPVPMARIHEWYKLAGSGMRMRDFDGWLEGVRADLGDDPKHPLAALRAVLDSDHGREFCRIFMLSPPIDCRRATRLAAKLEMPCPAIDAEQLQVWDRRLRAAGLIEDPVDDSGKPQRYMWFCEHLAGEARFDDDRRTSLELDFVASVASLRQLFDEHRVDLSGTVNCPGVHPHPLRVTDGHWWVRKHHGAGRRTANEASLISLSVELVDEDGRQLWLRGEKVARPRLDLWRQSRRFELELGDGRRTLLRGEAEVDAKNFLDQQVYGIEFRDDVPEAERRRARLIYLAWLGGNLGRTFYDLAVRLGISVVTGR